MICYFALQYIFALVSAVYDMMKWKYSRMNQIARAAEPPHSDARKELQTKTIVVFTRWFLLPMMLIIAYF